MVAEYPVAMAEEPLTMTRREYVARTPGFHFSVTLPDDDSFPVVTVTQDEPDFFCSTAEAPDGAPAVDTGT